MGGKKSSRKPAKKKPRPKLEKTFACPFCSHENSIECKLDKSLHVGSATCKTCSAGFQTVINYLSEPIDVYSEWVDAINERDLKKKRRKIADDESAGSRTQASINHDSDADK